MYEPIKLEVRQRTSIPIVEVQASSKLKIEILMNFMLRVYDYAERFGGRLIPTNECQKIVEENTVYYSIIFKNNKDATQYVEFLKNFH